MSETNGTDSKGQDPLIGRVINDRYKIVSVIARGGMGKVYKAEQAPLGRQVALKVLSPSYQGDTDPDFHRRFFLEASTSAKLSHPNTVTVFDYGRTDDDIFYIAMELLEGRTLHKAIRDEGPFSPERALHIARQISRSLREAHNMGVIHRDLKPANVYLVRHGDENDYAKVLDFGLVKDLEKEGEDLTQTGLFMGSPKYMSPEQIRGEKVDVRTDIYALGVILYEMLTGKVPFDRANSVNILMAHVHEEPMSMGQMLPGAIFSPSLDAIVRKAMAKRSEERYSSMDDFLNGLKDAGADAFLFSRSTDTSGTQSISGSYELDVMQSSGTPSSGFTGSVISRPEKPRKKSVAPMAIAAVVALAAIVGGGLAVASRSRSRTADRTDATGRTSGTSSLPTAAIAPTVAPPPAGAGAANAPTFTTVHVQLRSVPAGASVLVGGQTISTTPGEVDWTGDDARAGREVTFTFRLPGYRDYTVMRTIRNDSIAVEAHLEPAPTISGRRPTTGTRTTTPVREPRENFHVNPY